MSFIIGLLTAVLVLDCLVLIFLVLIQLPKKEAGAGMAFGAGATDALFGAGSGNALTKITKWSAGILFALAILISILNSHKRRQATTIEIPKELPGVIQPAAPTAPATPAAVTPAPAPAPAAEVPAAAPATTPAK